MRKLAVTGALGAGKSTVCQILAESGAHVVDADEIAHQLIRGACRQKIIQLLGSEITTDGEIDRQKVAKIVFKDRKKLKALEEILHPHILKEIQNTIEKVKHTHRLFAAEIPLLFECGWDQYFDITLCVTRKQPNLPPDWEERMKTQLSAEEKAAKADITLANDGTLADLKHQIQKLNLGATNSHG